MSHKKTLQYFALLIFLLIAFVLQNANANTITVGPVPDFKGIKTVTAKTTIPTGFEIPLSFGIWGYDLCSFNIDLTDKIDVKINIPVPVFAASYWTIEYPDEWDITQPLFADLVEYFGSDSNYATVVDIWAMDSNPSGEEIVLEGFNPTDPELVPLSDETFIGISDTEYIASVFESTVSNLTSLFPGYDLSAFDGVEGTDIVYVAQTFIPVNDSGSLQCIPEPSTSLLFGIGLLLVTGTGRLSWLSKAAKR